MGYSGVAITEHESVSSHVQAIKKTRELKDKGRISQDFKLILGNEIYLCDSLEEVKDNYTSGVTKFPHFILLSTSKEGHEILRILSSRAWSRSFYTGTMERVPTLKSDLEELVKPNKGLIIGSTACLGSEVGIHLLAIKEAEEENNSSKAELHKEKLHEFINWCIDVFGKEYFFLEMQPAFSEEQKYVNTRLVEMSKFYDLKLVITTDSHYARPEDRVIHEAFLNSKDGEREVLSFYEACFVQKLNEIYERMNYLPKDVIDEALSNTDSIGEMCLEYTIENPTIIPKVEIPEFEVEHLFSPAYEQYGYIEKMAYSEHEQDRFLIHLIEKGFKEHFLKPDLTKERFHKILDRINVELGELWEISKVLNQEMSAYYITVKEIVDIIWDDDGGNSIVGSGRGSAAGFLINMLLGITQIDPLAYEIEMPHWRHLHKSRADIEALDIDLDTEASKRPQIIQALKDHFGEDRILQVCTFGTMTSKNAIQTACRGLEIDNDISQYLSGLIPFERGQNWSLSDCLYGNKEKNRKPVKEFVREVEKYHRLKEIALKLEGKIDKRSIHAGGVILFPDKYYKSNAIMKAPNGLPITAYNLGDSQATGSIKFDYCRSRS